MNYIVRLTLNIILSARDGNLRSNIVVWVNCQVD